jgi:hypothetical protein
LIGNEWTFSAGIGLPIPFSAGEYQCSTVLDTVMVRPELSGLPIPTALAPDAVANGGLPYDLSGWACSDVALCAWSNDDALGAGGSGSAEVTSPGGAAPTNVATLGTACVAVVPGQPYDLSARAKTLGALPGTVSAVWNGGLDCDGAIVRSDVLGVSPPDETWRRVAAVVQAPTDAQTLWLEISAERDLQSGRESTSRMDLIAVPEPPRTPAALSVLLALALVSTRSRWHRARPGREAPRRRNRRAARVRVEAARDSSVAVTEKHYAKWLPADGGYADPATLAPADLLARPAATREARTVAASAVPTEAPRELDRDPLAGRS